VDVQRRKGDVMVKRVASKLSYANVMATVAVFLVLGGGITMAAISGDGSVRFGAKKGLTKFEWETVVNLPGIGKVQARCSKGTGVRFKNTSGGTLQGSVLREADSDFVATVLPDGGTLDTFALGIAEADDIDTMRFHVFKTSASGKPMADITVGHQYGDGACENRTATAQAVASE
jgi:hypothetical protein